MARMILDVTTRGLLYLGGEPMMVAVWLVVSEQDGVRTGQGTISGTSDTELIRAFNDGTAVVLDLQSGQSMKVLIVSLDATGVSFATTGEISGL